MSVPKLGRSGTSSGPGRYDTLMAQLGEGLWPCPFMVWLPVEPAAVQASHLPFWQ